jgi:hypothetical protein
MKKNSLLFKMQFVLLLAFFTGSQLFAGNIVVNENATSKFKVTENTYSSLEVTNVLSSINFVDVKTRDGYYTLLSVKDYAFTTTVGNPQLPVIKKLIEVPLNADYIINIYGQGYKEINLADYGIENVIIPAQPSVSKSIDNPEDLEFFMNNDAYQVNDYVGTDLVKVVDLGIMRGVRIARIEISPVLYNAVTNSIKVMDHVDVEVKFQGGNTQATMEKKADMFSPFFEGVYSSLINYKPLETKELFTDAPITYIIVSAPMFEAALQPFIEWKTKKGFNVVEAYTDDPSVGTTTTSIKSYLQDFYENPPAGYNSQSFVLMVGDVAQIPTFNGTAGGHVSDLYYHEYTGDLFPEVYYGRFSANNLTELQPQIDKTLEYEMYLFPDPSFLDEVVMVAGADGSFQTHSNGQINYGTTYYFNEAHGLTSHTYLQPEPGGGNYSQNIRQNVSDGVAFGNYTAHCSSSGWADPSFTISNISQLSNESKYPLLVGNCCLSVTFNTDCFGEELLRAENKGAVGYIGGSNSTYWNEDFWWGVGFESVSVNPVYNAEHLGSYDRTFHDHNEPLAEWYHAQGQMPAAGNMAVTQSGSSRETYYWEIYHLMGDPSLMIYFSQAPDATANYQGLMPLGVSMFTVNTDPYAYVAISKDGVLHGACVADETGLAEVEMFDPITVPGNADVVITGQNLKPYMGTVTVASPDGAYVLLAEAICDDSNGNNNGLVDFGENIMLNVTLENMGSETGTDLVATISATDANITLDNDTHNWPNVAAGATVEQTGAFEFTVADLIPDQHIVQFTLQVTDGTDTWESMFNVTLNAPVLTIGGYLVDDSFGNNNGRLDPGENADIIIPNFNEGGCDALDAVASAVTGSGLITINNASYNVGNIAIGGSQNAVFNITVDAAAQIGDVAAMNYVIESDPYSATMDVVMTIGLVIEDFESGDFESYDWEFAGNADWIITESGAYEGVYAAKSGDISDDQTSELSITCTVTADDQISFFAKVSSEGNYDYLRFFIDGVQQGEWDGEVAWTEVSYPVTAGERTFKWAFEKDYSVSSGSDCGWIDYIVFPPFAGGAAPLSVTASANPAEICEGESSQLNAFAMGGTGIFTYEWDPATGLDDPNIQNPTATPGMTTTYTVTVDDGNATIGNTVTVTVNETPDTPTITQNGNVLESSAMAGNQWYDSNGEIDGATGQTYEPQSTDDFYVMVTSEFGCESEASNMIYFIYTGLIEIAEGENVNIYPNPFTDQFTIDYELRTVADVRIVVYSTFGQQIAVLEDSKNVNAGPHKLKFDATRLEAGVYFCRIETDNFTTLKRIVLSK